MSKVIKVLAEKKPEQVYVFQYTRFIFNPSEAPYIPEWIREAFAERKLMYYDSYRAKVSLVLQIPEKDESGRSYYKRIAEVNGGDYILKNTVTGELSVCKEEFFEKLYKTIEEETEE